MEITIRSLKRKDRKTLAGLIKKLAGAIGDDHLLRLISSASSTRPEQAEEKDNSKDESQLIKLGLEILQLLLDVLETETTTWFADLAGVSIDDYDNLPFDVEIQIIEQLIKAEEAHNFFYGASRLYKKISQFAAERLKERTESGSIEA